MRSVLLRLAAVLCLSACSAGPQKATTFRDASAPIWSAAAFVPAQTGGSWRQVAGFAAAPGGCSDGAVTITPAQGGLSITGTLCLDGRAQAVNAIAKVTGPGRFAVAGGEDWWILWVDSGYRTLAVGTPSGAFGFVLDRDMSQSGGQSGDQNRPAPDRLAAAAEIFDFNGYDTRALRPF